MDTNIPYTVLQESTGATRKVNHIQRLGALGLFFGGLLIALDIVLLTVKQPLDTINRICPALILGILYIVTGVTALRYTQKQQKKHYLRWVFQVMMVVALSATVALLTTHEVFVKLVLTNSVDIELASIRLIFVAIFLVSSVVIWLCSWLCTRYCKCDLNRVEELVAEEQASDSRFTF